MAAKDWSITAFNAACGKSEGRDKIARIAQYGCRTITGLALVMQPEKGSAFKEIADKAPEVMKNLAMARRTHRWCKEFPVIQSIPKSLEIPGTLDRILDLVQKVSLASFMIIDHIGWLKQVKVYNGGKRTAAETIQLGLKCLFVSNSIAAIVGMQKLSKTSNDEKDAKKRADLKKGIFRSLLCVIQNLHTSKLFEFHDLPVGLCGVASSYIDTMKVWPELKN